MTWHILILGNTFLAAISYVIYRAAARKHRSNYQALSINASFYLFQFISELLILPFLSLGHIQLGKVEQFWPWLIGGGFGFAIANLFLYKLLTHVDAGLSSVLGTLNVVFTIIFASLVLHEELTTTQALGALVLFLAIIYALIVIKKPGNHRHSSRAWLWGLIFASLAGIFYGAAAVNEKFLVGHMNLSTYMVFGWGGQLAVATLMASVIQPSGLSKALTNKKMLYLSVTGGVTRGAAGLLFLLSLIKANNVAVVTVVSNFRLILIVLFGVLLLKERQKLPEKVFASLVAMVALAVIFWVQ